MQHHIKYMHEREYIEKIRPWIKSIDNIEEEMLDVLSLFVFHNHLSIYQIHKIISKYGRNIAYKNSYRKVQKLIDLKLIEKEIDLSQFDEKELEKGAKYYKLSEEGILALFYNSTVFLKPSIYYVQRAFENGKAVEDMSDIFSEYKKEIFKNHQNCAFFNLFLLPWISIETIEKVSEELFDIIRLFLNYCCNVVKDHIIRFSKRVYEWEDEGIASGFIGEIEAQEPLLGMKSVIIDDLNLFSYVKDILSKGINLTKIKDNNKSSILVIKPSDSNRRILLYKDKENIPNLIFFYKHTNGSSLFTYSISHRLLKPITIYRYEGDIDLKPLFFKALFSIMMGLSKDNDLKILKEDIKFMDTLSELKQKDNSIYQLLVG